MYKRFGIRFWVWALFLTSLGFAQRPAGPGRGPAICSIEGKVLDETNDQPLEFATVSVLMARNDSVITGGLTNSKGGFFIEEMRPGKYHVKINYIGYEATLIENVRVGPKTSLAVDLGNIQVSPGGVDLEEVSITGEQDMVIHELDKKVYRVDKMITTIGGSTNDILAQLPSVEVDLDGNISLRGSGNVNVLIDGKPSGLTGADRAAILEQLPANAIEKVEVITNPSAKYDPDGMSGILNIILKKNRKSGWNGGLTLTYGTWNRYTLAPNLNYRNKRFNLFASYSYQYTDGWGAGLVNKINSLEDTTFSVSQRNDSRSIRSGHAGRLGTDIYINRFNTLSLSGTINPMTRPSFETILFGEVDSENRLTRQYQQLNEDDRHRFGYDLDANYKKEFKKPNQVLTAGARYGTSDNYRRGMFTQSELYAGLSELDTIPFLRNNINENTRTTWTLQTDYVHPLTEHSKFETGAKATLRGIKSSFFSETFDDDSAAFVPDVFLNNDFEYQENVFAWYGIYGHGLERFSFQGGLRLEQTLTNFELLTTNENWENNYFGWFPSGHVRYEPKKGHELKASYSRRINRPSIRSLNPFTNFSDPLNLRFGNPRLQPEFIHVAEVSYLKEWKTGSFSGAIFYRNIRDMIQRQIDIDDEGVTRVTWSNFGKAESYGVELIARWKPLKFWNLMLSSNFNRTQIDGSNLEADLNADQIVARFRLLTDVRFGMKGPVVQLSGNYATPRVIAQGRIAHFFTLNFAVRQNFFDNQLSLSFRLSDPTDTRRFLIMVEEDSFVQNTWRKRESRVAYISLTYRFGKDIKSRRGRGRDGGMPGGGFGDDML